MLCVLDSVNGFYSIKWDGMRDLAFQIRAKVRHSLAVEVGMIW